MSTLKDLCSSDDNHRLAALTGLFVHPDSFNENIPKLRSILVDFLIIDPSTCIRRVGFNNYNRSH